jgi:hypothetical protein
MSRFRLGLLKAGRLNFSEFYVSEINGDVIFMFFLLKPHINIP